MTMQLLCLFLVSCLIDLEYIKHYLHDKYGNVTIDRVIQITTPR